MPYVNKKNGWNSRYACTLIRITPIPASAESDVTVFSVSQDIIYYFVHCHFRSSLI